MLRARPCAHPEDIPAGVYLNKHSHSIGWIFPTADNTVEFILPADIQNGRDDFVALDQDGKQVSFHRLHVTPKG